MAEALPLAASPKHPRRVRVFLFRAAFAVVWGVLVNGVVYLALLGLLYAGEAWLSPYLPPGVAVALAIALVGFVLFLLTLLTRGVERIPWLSRLEVAGWHPLGHEGRAARLRGTFYVFGAIILYFGYIFVLVAASG
jgi:hypothetical protein